MRLYVAVRPPFFCTWCLVLVIALLTWGKAASAQSPGSPIVVAQAREVAAVETIRLPGTVVATRVSRLSTAIGGLVQSIGFDLGDRVEAGDTILKLDDSLARHALDQAAAAVEEAQADAAEKRRLYRIGRNLTKRGVITQDQLDARAADMRMAQAVVKRLRADESAQNELLQRHSIVAPFTGVIASRDTEMGEWVAPGTQIVELVADNDVAVDVSLPQEFVASMQSDVSIALSINALAGQRFPAGRTALSPTGDATTRSFLLRIEPQADDIGLAPGMSAQALISFAAGESVIAIPRDALIRQPDGSTTVWVIEDTGEQPTVSSREVISGRANGNSIRITSGLQAGERVVVRGNESLQAGQPVRVVGHDK
ncbi:MAG: efflux RND transporter periplasmic adaptor subunit [Burkholderiaceae bacterium]